ncbi:class I SAM-dependent methyltransferase [Hamadaea tsunoensis]|uniref:class I SAM-dependent methyltransferase n=1 Tax=Hamadaea tsunoensis TaxID=53368 RepID=UPI000412ED09|nr:class I SAM-dependent methyltransferase [Hamadaea tsunoensis]
MDSAEHWRTTYDTKGDQVSWYQAEPAPSLRLLDVAGLAAGRSVIDIGGGASVLADRLLDRGVTDVTVLDIAGSALAAGRTRLGDRVTWLVQDLLTWRPERRYDFWHDRAVFHFLTEHRERDRYRRALVDGLAPDGRVVIGTFAADGPQTCSGLPTARYAPAELAAEFPGFEIVAVEREEHRTPWDSVQPFSWVVLRRG